jgi:hypothetical protein
LLLFLHLAQPQVGLFAFLAAVSRIERRPASIHCGGVIVIRNLFALIAGSVLLVLGFMFSLVLFAVIAVLGLAVWGFLVWKTRKLRRAMREQAAHEQAASGQVIDGEAVVIEEYRVIGVSEAPSETPVETPPNTPPR